MAGLLKSSSVKPTARSMARLGERPVPPVVVKLFRWLGSDIEFSSNRPSGYVEEESSFPE
jgi:hypothetical protein